MKTRIHFTDVSKTAVSSLLTHFHVFFLIFMYSFSMRSKITHVGFSHSQNVPEIKNLKHVLEQ